MISKHKKAQKGPSWFEVGLGALLSVILGVILGAAYLISKPVLAVKEIPKDAPSEAVYYIEGGRDFNKAALVQEKRKDFASGQPVSLEEGEVNAFIGSLSKPAAPSAAKPGDKGAPAADQKTLSTGLLNVRIRAGKIQFAAPVAFNVFGVTGSVIVQSSGVFSRHGSVFVFDPEVSYLGACPIQHLLFVRDIILSKFLFAQPVPEDIASAWSKLAAVTIEGSTLRLKMP